MGKSGPTPPDYTGAANKQADASRRNVVQQTTANRPNQSSPFASSNWSQGPDGQWSQSTSLDPRVQQAIDSLSKLDFSSLPAADNGQQAADAAYNQSTSRLDPEFAHRDEAERAQLANQGLDPNSEAGRNAMRQLANERTDAYSGARNQSFAQGQQAANNSVMRRQAALAELLKKAGLPMEALQGASGLTGQAGFNAAGSAESPQLLAASGMQGQYQLQKYLADTGMSAEVIKGIMGALAEAAKAAAAG